MILAAIKSEHFAKSVFQIENGRVLETSDLLVKELFNIQYRKY